MQPSPTSVLPRLLAALWGGQAASPALVGSDAMGWEFGPGLACPGAGQEEDRGGSSLIFLSFPFTSPLSQGLAEAFTFEPLFRAEKIQLG